MRSGVQRASLLLVLALAVGALRAAADERRTSRWAPAQKPPAILDAVGATLELENEDTHVWKMRLPPGQTSVVHRHNHPRVIVALTGGAVKLMVKGAQPRVLRWQTGGSYWLPADPPGQYHAYLNEGERPIEFTYIEFERSR